MAYNVYSLSDCKSVLYHPDAGTTNLHQCGMGKIAVSAAGELMPHTTAADKKCSAGIRGHERFPVPAERGWIPGCFNPDYLL